MYFYIEDLRKAQSIEKVKAIKEKALDDYLLDDDEKAEVKRFATAKSKALAGGNVKYAIRHHSKMTDINIYFISKDKDKLLASEKAIDDLIWGDYDGDEFLKKLKALGLTLENDETGETPKADKAILLKSYSYRF